MFLQKLKSCRSLKKYACRYLKSENVKHSKPPWKILFFGSDNFSLYSLKTLYREHQNNNSIISILKVVTNSNKNPIWKFAEKHDLNIQKWPPDLIQNEYDLGVVVSFGHLIPENIINKFPLGMLNVHASLLPRWRGAAPIIYALANGDKETGITIMNIKPKHFDIGDIVLQKKINISDETKMPELHERLGKLGASCLLNTLNNLEEYLSNSTPQPAEGVTYAPKNAHNLHRALDSLRHNLFTSVASSSVKLIDIEICKSNAKCIAPGSVTYDKPSQTLRVECANGTFISVKRISVLGKKVMTASEFNNGYLKYAVKFVVLNKLSILYE
ncbi:methionyl-tRNA formyltransferase, mitochondrial-like [Sitophilus oryzae]|uniref:Methionyl-tRNA formyltransferase, mitochondrial n=1 Tax=Sitophilus oryzae TaxID=7048 RepID=A0A6J2XKH8_SITOR|nr:methionyl-tRNA formyltransferase, mitochondrial-like [Sitophilus oryzae]